jgi:hypothetical protein
VPHTRINYKATESVPGFGKSSQESEHASPANLHQKSSSRAAWA